MTNRDIQEVIIGIGLLTLLALIINPADVFMPTPLIMTIVVAIAILAFLFTSFIWREQSEDERETLHRLLASRAACLSGAAFLLLGMIIQARSGSVDSWLAGSLGVMVLAKLTSHVYNRAKK